ncbi:hypothetical protein D5S17_04915 [Pseudonocardiaceae bacterium YIM PH 21723]|nr:hypothetical protein D5S17_04915 [Pseudonocardiaceae bacterium YIM PH 21723]
MTAVTLTDAELSRFTAKPARSGLRGGFSAVTWTNAAQLTEAERDRLDEVMIRLQSRVYDGDATEVWRQRRADGFFDLVSKFHLIRTPAAEVIGWMSLVRRRLAGAHVIYLDSTGMLPEYQRSGRIYALHVRDLVGEMARNWHRMIYLSMRTRNPVVYKEYLRGSGGLGFFPMPERPVPDRVRAVAAELAVALGQRERLDEATLVIKDAYQDELRSGRETPESGDPVIDGFFAGHLGPGDAYLIFLEATLPRMIGFLIRDVKTLYGRMRRATNATKKVRNDAPKRVN